MRAILPKIHILRFVWEQGVVSVDDVTRQLFQPDKFCAVRIALYKLGLSHVKYKDIKNGVWFIDRQELFELLNHYYPELPPVPIHKIPVAQFQHCLEINRIRTTLEKSSQILIDKWWSENYIRCLPSSIRQKYCPSQMPDALFWVKRKDGTSQLFFLEFERSLKAKDRYEEIFLSYAKHPEIGRRNVLYICQTPDIREELLSIETNMVKVGKLEQAGMYFQFVTLTSFYKTYSNEPLTKEEACDENLQVACKTAV